MHRKRFPLLVVELKIQRDSGRTMSNSRVKQSIDIVDGKGCDCNRNRNKAIVGEILHVQILNEGRKGAATMRMSASVCVYELIGQREKFGKRVTCANRDASPKMWLMSTCQKCHGRRLFSCRDDRNRRVQHDRWFDTVSRTEAVWRGRVWYCQWQDIPKGCRTRTSTPPNRRGEEIGVSLLAGWE